jgi:superfamily I DNA/RNA helicase
MVERVLHLTRAGVDPRRILVLMFNKSAQEEFSRRLKKACVLEGLPAAEADYRHSVTQLEHALARQRHQGVGATLIQAPHDIQPDGILRPERTGRGGFVLQLTLPATPWRAP